MQNFSQIGEVPWPRPFNITRILQSMTLKRVKDSKQFPTIAIKSGFHRGKGFVKQFKLLLVNKKGMTLRSEGTSVSTDNKNWP